VVSDLLADSAVRSLSRGRLLRDVGRNLSLLDETLVHCLAVSVIDVRLHLLGDVIRRLDGEVGVRNGDRCGGRGGRSQGCEACACCCECDCVADGIALLTVLTHRNSCLSLLPLGGVLIRFLFSGCLPAGLLPSPFSSRKKDLND